MAVSAAFRMFLKSESGVLAAGKAGYQHPTSSFSSALGRESSLPGAYRCETGVTAFGLKKAVRQP